MKHREWLKVNGVAQRDTKTMTLCTMWPRSWLELFQSLLSTTIFCSSCCRPDFLSCLLTVLTTATHASMLLQVLFRLSSPSRPKYAIFSFSTKKGAVIKSPVRLVRAYTANRTFCLINVAGKQSQNSLLNIWASSRQCFTNIWITTYTQHLYNVVKTLSEGLVSL
jgi:hypothetical protein